LTEVAKTAGPGRRETSEFRSPPPPPEEEMAVPAPAKVARALAASAAVLVLLWCVRFRGGLSLGSPANKGLIFNVRPTLLRSHSVTAPRSLVRLDCL